jgi:RNA recognition motif-containing protein
MNNSNSKNKLFIGNLSWKATEEDLRPLFEQYGTVVKINVVYDGYTHKSRGFGFVEMSSPEEAVDALEKLNDAPLMGRNLRISLAEERRDDARGNGGMGGGMGAGNRDRDFRREREPSGSAGRGSYNGFSRR